MRSMIFGFALLGGCAYDEGIIIGDMTGTIVLPREAATRTFTHSDGSSETVTDARLIGPVYIGYFPGVEVGSQGYTSPVQGPVFQEGQPGNTYPYGGASIGDIRFPCVEALKCRVVSGRYVNFDEIVSWFNDTLQSPIADPYGNVIQSGDYIAEQCFDVLNYVDESEIRLTASEDRNDDGVIDKLDLDFVEQADGTFAAQFTVRQQEYFQSDEGVGFTLWGWMDAPSEASYQFSTCDMNDGFQQGQYNSNFFAGRPYRALLNAPTQFIADGDWVASEGYVYSSADDTPTLNLDFRVGP
jgi:hypothetical protein